MDPLFFKKFEEAKAEALSKLVKQPEVLIARRDRWALTSDSYCRWLYLTDCIRRITVEIPVPMLGDDVIREVTWQGEKIEVSGWNGSFCFHPEKDALKAKPVQRELELLLGEFRIEGLQMLDYMHDTILVRCIIKTLYSESEDSGDPIEVRLSGVSVLSVYDLEQKFSPDQWYELASLEEENKDEEVIIYRRVVWTAGNRMHLALVQEVEVNWVNVEELELDLDHIFSMMPWQKEMLTEEEMDLFVKTYADIEGSHLLKELSNTLERFISENPEPALTLVKLFYEIKTPLQEQLDTWNTRLSLLQGSLINNIKSNE